MGYIEAVKAAREYLESIKKGDGVAIVYNNDLDGIAACALLKRYLVKKGVEPYIIGQPMPPEKYLIRKIQTGVPDRIIFTDMAMDTVPKTLDKLKGIAQLLVIDHHVISRDLNAEGVVHLNPRMKDAKIYQSASYTVFDLLLSTGEKCEAWIAALGAIADYNLEYSNDLLEKVGDLKQYREASDMLEAARMTKKLSCDQIVDMLAAAKSPDEVVQRKELAEAFHTVEQEVAAELSEAEAAAEKHGNIIFYGMKSKDGIKSLVATKLGEKHQKAVVVVYSKKGKTFLISVRNQSGKINTTKLLRQAASGMKGVAYGGHESASGANVPEKHWEEFRARMVKIAGSV